MRSARLTISDEMFAAVHEHLFGSGLEREQGGFLLCTTGELGHLLEFSPIQWVPLTPADYVYHEADYLELRDQARASLIKSAHDAAAALVEIHSHPSSHPAGFSTADISGLAEFVPHIRWRLKKRPYGALVFGTTSLDGLAWCGSDPCAIPLGSVVTPTCARAATGLTRRMYGEIRHG